MAQMRRRPGKHAMKVSEPGSCYSRVSGAAGISLGALYSGRRATATARTVLQGTDPAKRNAHPWRNCPRQDRTLMRCLPLAAAALCLLTACGLNNPPESVPISGAGDTGGGTDGGSVNGVAIRSHNPGTDCLSCHKTGGAGASGGIFTVAGTVYKNGGTPQIAATVTVYPVGSTTAQATMTTDGLGNFFTTQAVASLVPAAGQQFAQGAHVVVNPTGGTSRSMLGVITNGSCNACHSSAGGVARVTAQKLDMTFGASIESSGGNGESTAAAAAVSTEAEQIATGAHHACIVNSDGGVQCWGANDQGQLGAHSGDQATPVAVTALGSVLASTADRSIAAGDNHTCVLSQGFVQCWGANDKGQLGNGTTIATELSAPALAGVTALSASGNSTCAQLGTGEQASFYCWGKQQAVLDSTAPRLVSLSAGELPAALLPLLGNTATSNATPVVAGLEAVTFKHISTSTEQGCGITNDSRIKCWNGAFASVDIPLH
jgi:hypothetical protein